MSRKLIICFSVVAVLFSLNAFAADDDPNLHLIKARQGEMQVRSFSAGPLFAMAKGEMPYDAELATKLANNLKTLLTLELGAAWAPDTGNDKYAGKTAALPEVWSTYPKVAEAGKEYGAAVNALAEVAGDGLEQLREKIGDLGDGCKGCHDDFREKE